MVAVIDREIGEMLWRFTHHERRVFGEWIGDIRIKWCAITMKLPVGRNGDFFP